MARSKRRTALWLWIITLVVVAAVLAVIGLAIKQTHNADQRMYTRGVLYLRRGQAVDAIMSFRNAIARNPEHLPARKQLIEALLEHKDFDEALKEIEEAKAFGLSEEDATLQRARIYASRATHRLQSAGKALTADLCADVIANDLNPAIEIVGKSAQELENSANYHRLGILCSQKSQILFTQQQLLTEDLRNAQKAGSTEKIVKLSEEIRYLSPEIRTVQQRAMGAYKWAIELDPEGADASRLAMAENLLITFIPQVISVRKVLKPLIEREEPNADALRLMALTEKEAGNTQAAMDYLEKFQKVCEDPKSTRLMQATLLADMEKWGPADVIVNDVLTEQPRNTSACYLKGRILMAQNKPDEAVKALQSIFAGTSRQWPQARFLLGKALLANGARQQAITAFQDTLADAASAGMLNLRGRYELRDIRYETGLMLTKELISTNPESAADFGRMAFMIKPEAPKSLETARAAYEAAKRNRDIRDLVAMHTAAIAVRKGPEAGLDVLAEERPEIQNDARIRILKGRLLMRSGAFLEAEKLLGTLREDYPKELLFAHELAALEYRIGHLEKSQEVYEDILMVDPANVAALSGVVQIMMKKGDLDGARQRLKDAEVSIGEDRIRSALIATYLREDRPEEALPLIRAQIEDEPDNATNYVALANLLWVNGDIEEARETYDKAIQLAPDNFMGYRRGLLDLMEGHYADAVSLFETATKEIPRSPDAHLDFAIALYSNGAIEDAISTLKRIAIPSERYTALLDQPRWALAIAMAGENNLQESLDVNKNIVSQQMGIPQERAELLEGLAAIESPELRHQTAASLMRLVAFVHAIALHAGEGEVKVIAKGLPDLPLPACWIPLIRVEMGQYNEAIKELQTVMEHHSDFAQGYIYLGLAYGRNGELDSATQAMEEALKVADRDYAPSIHLELGKILEAHKQYDAALSHYQEALANLSLTSQANNNIAWILATIKDRPDEAVIYAEHAVKADPRNPAIQDTLGWVYFLTGKADKAQTPLEFAKAGLSANPSVRYHLGAVYHKLGETEKAIAELKEALALTPNFPEAEKSRMLLERMGTSAN